MPNAAAALVIGGFATGLGLATLVALPGQTPTPPVAALPERPAPAPAPDPREIILAGLDAVAPGPGGGVLAPRAGGAARDRDPAD